MPDARELYETQPEAYDELVRYEDHEGHLLPAIHTIAPLEGKRVVELGAGTGRVTKLIAPHVASVRAFDIAAPMVEVGTKRLAELGIDNVVFGVADNASIPAENASADLALAGWTYGHQTVWHKTAWRAPIEKGIGEMLRVLEPGGHAVIIETLGTGFEAPFDPPEALGRYYAMLEDELGFSRTWIRTDYAFPSLDVGEKLVRFFFGNERAEAFARRGSTILPECTGLWSRRK